MLFDLRPKESRRDLYGRDEELEELARLVESGSWVVVVGRRMTGKTSLVKTFAREFGGAYVNLMGVRGLEGLVEALHSQAGFKLRELTLDLKLVKATWSRALMDAFKAFEGSVLVLDEVQELASPQFLKVLKRVWDTYPGLRLVFTGSLTGVLRGLLEPSPSSPLYGRSPVKLELKPFTREASLRFLKEGFRELKVQVSEGELEEVVDSFNGYVGWLTYYGNLRAVRKLSHREALNKAWSEGAAVMKEELERFLQGRRREVYVRALRAMALGARWSELKRLLGVNPKVLSGVLKTLRGAMIVSEESGLYYIPDPVTRRAVQLLKA